MGNGIAQVAARSGFPVTLCDVDEAALSRAWTKIGQQLARDVSKGKLEQHDANAAIARIEPTIDLASAAHANIVIEAVPERLALKQELFSKLEMHAPAETIFASNTSSLSITQLAAATRRPERFIGMHFMNPVPVMKLVEIVRGIATSQETFETVRQLALRLEKTPVEAQDFPGFISNRVLMPMINEAVYCVMEGVATPEAIDEVMRLGMNHPMGPLTLADFIGLDVCLDIMQVLYDGFSDSKYRPCPLLRKMVAAGWLGRKSGRGFYRY
jgi:3-hydroxybutyryl-CoA dehydrogenase